MLQIENNTERNFKDLVRYHFVLFQSANLELALGHRLDYVELHYYRARSPSFEAQPDSLAERF